MKRSVLPRLLLLATLILPVAALHAAETKESSEEPQNYSDVLKWANTLIFAAALGYLLSKSAPKFFNARSADIQKAIKDATGLKIEAEFRSSEIDRKMATLPEEVKRLRAASDIEMEHEHQRLLADTKAEIEHIHRNVAAESEALREEATLHIRYRSAAAAFDLAAARLRDRLTPADQRSLVNHFVDVVEHGKK